MTQVIGMYILSFDVASKSLAVSIIQFNENWRQQTDQAYDAFNELYDDCDACDIHILCKLVIDYLDVIENIINI